MIIMDLTMRKDEGGQAVIRKCLTFHPEVRAVISGGYIHDPEIRFGQFNCKTLLSG